MVNRTDAAVESINISLLPGETAETEITVQNSRNSVSQFTFSVKGLKPGWYNLPVSSTTLFPNDEERIKIFLHPPKTEEPKTGLYPFQLVINCLENPDDSKQVKLLLEIQESPEMKLSITPELVTGKSGIYKVAIRNPGDKDITVNLQVAEKDSLLRCRLRPLKHIVPAGGTIESTLKVKLKWWHYFYKRKDYQFTVSAEQSEPQLLKTVIGRLHKPGRKAVPRHAKLSPERASPRRQPPEINIFEASTEDNRKFNLTWSVARAIEVKLNDVITGLEGNQEINPIEATTYTLTATNKHGSTSRTVDIEPLLVPEEKYSDRILLLMTPDHIRANAGSESVEAMLEVQNVGNIVDRFSLVMEGIPESWYSLSESSVALMPRAKEQVQISFHPPKVPGVKAGIYTFAVTLRSQSIPEDSASTTARLEILPSVDYSIAMKPYRMRCRRKCTFQLQATSKDVSNANIFIDVIDIENGLTFQIENDSPVIPPWQTLDIPMLAKPKRNSIVGDIKRYDISITASTAEGYTQLARCQMDHKPLLRSWRPILRTVKYIVIIGIAGFAIYYVIHLGGGWGSLVRDPQGWLEGMVRHIRGWFY